MRQLLLASFLTLAVSLSFGQSVTITDNGGGTGTRTLSADTTYILDGFVFVNSGDVLTIEPGTVIQGNTGTAENSSALIVARGGKIMAEGTKDEPIIFTSISDTDPINNPLVGTATQGLWGGVIILGNASLNSNPGETAIEGIPTSEPRGLYGGSDDMDNSGILQYVSIKHGGTNIGAGNEINGLTLGGVGAGTTIDHVEIMYNADDGIEFFGGTVGVSHLIIGFCQDDAIDYDEGFRGWGQFIFVIQPDGDGDRGGEHDGGTDPEDGLPYAHPMFYNVTSIGEGTNRTITFRDNAAGEYHNSIFYNYGKGIDVELLASGESSVKRFEDGDLVLGNNIFSGVAGDVMDDLLKVSLGSGVSSQDSADAATALKDSLVAWGNTIVDPMFAGVNKTEGANGLDPRPTNTAAILTADPNSYPSGMLRVSYKGAFAPAANDFWAAEWSTLDKAGYLGTGLEFGSSITITDNGSGTGTTTWTSNNTYLLDGFVFVNSGDVLTIEAGTVVKGLPGQAENASALIVARGGRIIAEGTKDEPIIFTSSADDPWGTPLPGVGTQGLWGGVIILGAATLNSNPGETAIEGIPTSEPRGLYGGSDDTDDSGILKYVSIRHGGTNIGAGNEINGLTLGGVGSGTEFDHIEVIYNADDGIEFFGGTAQVKHLIIAFCQDDAIDYDEGWRGKIQYAFVLQPDGDGDRGGEHDGGTDPEDGTPYAHPHIYNVTSIGEGTNRTITFRDNAAGEYHNSIFYNYGKGIDVELLASGEDAYKRYQAGSLKLENNLFFMIDDDQDASIFNISAGSGVAAQDEANAEAAIDAYFTSGGNMVADPLIQNIDKGRNELLDPTIGAGSPAYSTTMSTEPSDGFFENAGYKGAFGTDVYNMWAAEWSGLATLGYLRTDFVSGIESEVADIVYEEAGLVYPNPVSEGFALELPSTSNGVVDVTIFTVAGEVVMETAYDGQDINVSGLESGLYFVTATEGSVSYSSKFIKE